MSELVASLKGPTGQDPWLVLHAEDAETLDHLLDEVSGDLMAKVYNVNKIFQNVQAVAPLAPSPSVPQSSSAAPQPQPATQNPPPAAWQPPEVPQYQPPAAQTSTAPPEAPSAGLPNGVKIWTGPSSKNPQYNAVYVQYPFISDAGARKALQERLKDKGWAKPFDTNAKPWIYEVPKSSFTEADARNTFIEFANAFG